MASPPPSLNNAQYMPATRAFCKVYSVGALCSKVYYRTVFSESQLSVPAGVACLQRFQRGDGEEDVVLRD